jgi:magnesium chelatase family protein
MEAANSCYSVLHGCPCGYFADPKHTCRCSYQQIHRYRSKISGPLLDRIDIHVEVPAVPYKDLMQESYAEPSKDIRRRVSGARQIQSRRLARTKIFCNAKMSSRHIRTHCKIDDDSRRLLESAIDKLGLSARAFNRVLKIARTIADLEDRQDVQVDHISEAIQYRNLDRGSQFK